MLILAAGRSQRMTESIGFTVLPLRALAVGFLLFLIWGAPAWAQQTITYNHTVSGGISTDGQIDLYTIVGTANDVIQLNLLQPAPQTGPRFCYNLLMPNNGGSLHSDCGYNSIADQIRLVTSGTYQIQISVSNAVFAAYTLQITCVGVCTSTPGPPFPSRATPQALTYNQTVSGGISTDGQIDLYTIVGTANDVIQLNLLQPAPQTGPRFCYNLLMPNNGGSLHSDCGYNSIADQIRLVTSGTYQIQISVSNGVFAAYTLQITCVGVCTSTPGPPFPSRATPQALTYNQTVSGGISTDGQIDLYTIVGTANDVIQLNLLQPAPQTGPRFCYNLLMPNNGGSLHSDCGYNSIADQIRLVTSGTYQIQISVSNGVFAAYTLQITCVGACVSSSNSVLVSPTSLSFSYQSNAPPSAQTVEISSPGSPVAFVASAQTSTPSGGSWLAVSPASGTTPSNLTVSIVNPSSLPAGTYSGTVTVSLPDKSGAQTVTVRLVVAGPVFNVQAPSLQFTVNSTPGSSQQLVRVMLVTSQAGQNVDIAAQSKNGSPWLAITPQAPVTVSPGQSAQYQISVVPNQLPGGLLQYADSVVVSGGGQSIEVPLSVVMSTGPAPQPLLSTNAVTLFTKKYENSLDYIDFLLYNAGTAPLDWTATADVMPSMPPLITVGPNFNGILNPGDPPQTLTLATTQNVAQLVANGNTDVIFRYSGLPEPDYLNVVIDVVDSLPPRPSLAGLLVGLPGPDMQKVTLINRSGVATGFSIDPSTLPSWLPVTPLSGQIPASQNNTVGSIDLIVGPANPAGRTTGDSVTIPVSFSGFPTPQNIQAVYAGSSSSTSAMPAARRLDGAASQACVPSKLTAVFASPGLLFQVPATLPVNVAAKVADNCGNILTSGAALVTFSSGESPLTLKAWPDGYWRGTWQPPAPQAGLVTLTLSAASPNVSLATQSVVYGNVVSGNIVSSGQAPVVLSKSVVDSASLKAAGDSISPGEIITIYGTNLASQSAPVSSAVPVTTLGNVDVRLGNEMLSLFFVGPNQINAVAPFDLPVGQTLQLIVERNGNPSVPLPLTVVPTRPGIYSTAQNGSGPGAIIGPSGAVADEQHPVHAGDVVSIFCTGLGAVNPAGDLTKPAPSQEPLPRVTGQVGVIIGNASAETLYAGLAPGFYGLYQVNVRVPATAPTGDVPVQISINNIPSNQVTLAIH